MADSAVTPLAVGLAGTGAAAAFLPGVDISAIIGAFGGALVFVIFAKDISKWQRAGYLIAGWIGGYMAAAEVLSLAWTATAGFASFVAGFLCIVVAVSAIEAFQTGKWPAWLGTIGNFLQNRLLGRGKVE